MAGLLRLAHPFPSILTALATGAIALLAGAGRSGAIGPELAVAARLGLAMLGFQVSIGALNDLSDIELDRARKPGKPLPRGAVQPAGAILLAVAGLALGIGLSVPSGPVTIAVGVAGAALGYAYDLGLSRTRWSWLPLAAALPLLPTYAWIGATGVLPTDVILLIPIGVVAGIVLALANGIADEERDRDAGVDTAVVRLGRGRAWIVHLVGLAAVIAAAALLAPRPALGSGGEAWGGAVGLGAVLALAGLALAAAPAAALRERGWELESLGLALVGVAWLAGVAVSTP